MEIWIILTTAGIYVKAFKEQQDAFEMYNRHRNRYQAPLQDYAG